MQLRSAGNRNDPRFLGQQPREGYLRGRRVFTLGKLAQKIDQGLVRFASLGREARHDVAEVVLLERGVLIDLAREEATPQWTVRNKADAELFARRLHFRFGSSPPQRILVLQRGDGLDRVRAS